MKKLSVFLYTDILGKKVYDEFGDVLGDLRDIYVTTDDGYPRAIGYKVKRGSSIYNYEFRIINFFDDNGKIIIKTKGSREILTRRYSYLLSENLMNKKIVDINGKQVVKVKDLKVVEIAGEYKVVAVEAGNLGRFKSRRLSQISKMLYKALGKEYEDKIIPWEDVESLDLKNNNLQLSNSYKKISSLHPADIADILEDLDEGERKKVFESLDEDLAADTFEEIDDEYKSSIIKELSESKTAELLENMDNDEIADLLDGLEEEEKEKILVNLEKDDAEEVQELMKYEDETVGSIMSKEFVSFNVDVSIEDTIDIIKEMDVDEEALYCIFVVDEVEKVKGTVKIQDLLLKDKKLLLKDVMDDKVIAVNHSEAIAEAIEQIAKYDLLLTPVVDDEEKLVGVVLIHDIIDEYLYPLWKKKN
ncbi:CBS domain-containing protein [Clostridium sp. MSJ-8]|uniref:magnesium transporter MgtE N-terminal domain-containing protein n=1 Tax=Clostridium sp. MSJ-8 TaxID=2841510 RepID=UPI001C0EB42E|nr:CBS domain-containing protein [Clostridium sp. MSJ-8]MBU5488907.1 CBS domain-containing protein [Clostridium sp. MSJ-8]